MGRRGVRLRGMGRAPTGSVGLAVPNQLACAPAVYRRACRSPSLLAKCLRPRSIQKTFVIAGTMPRLTSSSSHGWRPERLPRARAEGKRRAGGMGERPAARGMSGEAPRAHPHQHRLKSDLASLCVLMQLASLLFATSQPIGQGGIAETPCCRVSATQQPSLVLLLGGETEQGVECIPHPASLSNASTIDFG